MNLISKNKKIFYLISIVVLCLAYFVINAIAQSGQNKNIEILLEYKSGTEFDVDDNGVETIDNVIDFTVEKSVFNWDVDESKLCTKWNVDSDDGEVYICYGDEECCSFIDMASESSNWNDVFYLNYGRYGASYNSLVSAQVVYVDFSLVSDDPYEEVVYSKGKSLTANFKEENFNTKIDGFSVIPLLAEGDTGLIQNTNIQFTELKDCKTEYWETEEPVDGTCQSERTETVCDDYPINKSCYDEIVYYNYTCKTGTQTVQHSKEVCKPKELRITRSNELGRIDFASWGKCNTQEEADALIVICDSRYDGNNDGICQSGESCVKFVVTEQNVERYLKNSQEEFTVEDESFFLEKLDYEVMAK